jgi:ferredoxin-NADP reductase
MQNKENLMTEETFRFRVDRIIPESPRVKTFHLRPEGSDIPFHFLPGQHMGVRPIGEGVSGPESEPWRHFSLSGSPLGEFLEITVLRQGRLSDRMHSLVRGDWVEATRPVGNFVLAEAVVHGPVFFAGGIGIAPIRSMLRFCLDKGLGRAIDLFASFPTAEQAIYREELKEWADRCPRLSVWLTYTAQEARPSAQGSESHPWDRAFLEERIERPLQRVYYLCAPGGLMEQVEDHLASIGVPQDQVHKERW